MDTVIKKLEEEGFEITPHKWSSWFDSGITYTLISNAMIIQGMSPVSLRMFYRGYFMGKGHGNK